MIRPAHRSDHLALKALEDACFDYNVISLRSMKRFLGRPTASLVVHEDEEGLGGYALTLFRGGSALARVYSIAVDPGRRRHGLAAGLLAAAEVGARERGCTRLGAEVRPDNHASRGLFARAGFTVVSTLSDFYEDGSAALRLEKRLDGAARAASSW